MSNTRLVALGCVLIAAVTACGGSSKPTVASSTTPPTKGASGAKPAGTQAPDALVVAKVIATTNLAAAFSKTSGVQDNGGLSTPNGDFTSQATIDTPHAGLTITLTSAVTAAAAESTYSLSEPSSVVPSSTAETLVGIGDKAIASGNSVTVLKGAQVLQIGAELNDAAEKALENAKMNGTSPTQSDIDAATKAPLDDAKKAAKVIAAQLTGAAATSAFTYLPTGALDPCGVDTSKLGTPDVKVTSAAAFSDSSPMSECVFTYTGANRGDPGTGSLAVYTLTTQRGAAAQPAITPADQYKKIVAGYVSQGALRGGDAGYGSGTSGPMSIAGKTVPEPDFAMLVDLPQIGSQTLIRISTFRSSYVVDWRHCYEEITKMFDAQNESDVFAKMRQTIGDAATDAAKRKLRDDITDWCKAEEASGRPATGSHG